MNDGILKQMALRDNLKGLGDEINYKIIRNRTIDMIIKYKTACYQNSIIEVIQFSLKAIKPTTIYDNIL